MIPRLYNRADDMDRSAATTRPIASVSAADPPLASSSSRNDDAAAIPRLYNRTDPEQIPRTSATTVTTRPLVVDEQEQRLGTTQSLAPPQQNDVSTDGRRVAETAGLQIADYSRSNNSADVEDVWGDDDDLSLDNNGADDDIAQPDTTTGVMAKDDDDDFSPLAAPVGTMRHTTTATIVNRKRWVNPRLHARRSLFLVSK
jgi:hypothetical protein